MINHGWLSQLTFLQLNINNICKYIWILFTNFRKKEALSSFKWVEALSTTQAALQALAAMNSSLTILRPLWATAVRRWTRLSNHQIRVKEKNQNRRYQVFLDCEQHLRRNLWERKKRCTSRGLISYLLCITIIIFHYYNFRHYHYSYTILRWSG